MIFIEAQMLVIGFLILMMCIISIKEILKGGKNG